MSGRVKFAWKPEYALGIPDVDRQHQEFFRIVNELEAASLEGVTEASARKALAALINYACYHFATEEEFLRSAGYPEAALRKHVGQHEGFVKKVRDLRDALCEGKGIGPELADFAGRWLIGHITKTDLQYAKHFAGRNRP